MRLKRKASEKGFTLAEMLLAVGIAAYALCGIVATYIACFSLISTSKNVSIATAAAQGLLEEIRTDFFPQIVDDYDLLIFAVNGIPSSRGVVYVDDTNPELLRITISICWRQNLRVIGEDKNLNGVLNTGEDANSNGIIDSPVEIVALVANR
jgi:type II secretory pathway pseudopilin PulG